MHSVVNDTVLQHPNEERTQIRAAVAWFATAAVEVFFFDLAVFFGVPKNSTQLQKLKQDLKKMCRFILSEVKKIKSKHTHTRTQEATSATPATAGSLLMKLVQQKQFAANSSSAPLHVSQDETYTLTRTHTHTQLVKSCAP